MSWLQVIFAVIFVIGMMLVDFSSGMPQDAGGACKAAVAGDNCWALGNACQPPLTVDALVAKNPGLNCNPLQINTKVCC